MELTLRIDLEAEGLRDDGGLDIHELANTLRRTAHQIEGCDGFAEIIDGTVTDQVGRAIGAWVVL